MATVFNFVRINFVKHPIISNSVIYGTLYFGAECTQQILNKKILTEKPTNLDHATLARYAFYGIAIQGPLLTVWFRWLDNKFVGKAVNVVLKKMLVDQCLCVPPILIMFFTSMSIMEGKADIFEELRSKFVQTYRNSCFFWLPVQGINFMFVPPAFRVVYIGVASFAWVNILCYIKRQEY